MATTDPKRVCGDCKACCTALKVDELPKAEWQRCKHVGPLGCKIHRTAPASCRVYACGWLQGMGGRDDRPDRLGVVISPMVTEELGEHALVHEMRPGALQSPRARHIVSQLVRHCIVFDIQRDSMRKLIGGPPEQLRPLMEKAHAAGVLTVNGERLGPDVNLDQVLASARARP